MNDSYMQFEQFEYIFSTMKKTIECLNILFQSSDKLQVLPDKVYAEVLRLHNTAIDFLIAYNNTKEEK